MDSANRRERVVIMGAAGRDFHNFNVVYRGAPDIEVVAFTAAQIPGIGGRRYPPGLAGVQYPQGIPIFDEADLGDICHREQVTQVVFAYSDVSHADVMHAAARVLTTGADFILLGPHRTMIGSVKPVIAVCAARTGCGKSQTSRWIAGWLARRGLKAAVLRHPMPYGDLQTERLQRFASAADLDDARCTAEEREEYEPLIDAGQVVYAGVDYVAILEAAEQEADVIVWDGGNNDFSFIQPDLSIAVVDALRPRQIDTHHPGETVVRMADVVVVNKVDAAACADVQRAIDAVRAANPTAKVLRSASPVRLDDPEAVAGRRAIVVEDGPTLTHGGMPYGAGYVAAVAAGASEIVDPRACATDAVQSIYATYPHIGRVLPAVGYSRSQLEAVAATLDASAAEVIVAATPCDLSRIVEISKPIVRAHYDFEESGEHGLNEVLDAFATRLSIPASAAS